MYNRLFAHFFTPYGSPNKKGSVPYKTAVVRKNARKVFIRLAPPTSGRAVYKFSTFSKNEFIKNSNFYRDNHENFKQGCGSYLRPKASSHETVPLTLDQPWVIKTSNW
jgi:hypothetical protein